MGIENPRQRRQRIEAHQASVGTPDVSKMKQKSWWRKDSPVRHRIYGEGVITNFVGCNIGWANVYFYKGECTYEVDRNSLTPLKRGDPVQPI